MRTNILALLGATYYLAFAFGSPLASTSKRAIFPRQNSSCENTATSRSCWGEYSIDTNYYDVTPDTGVTKEFWLVAENTTIAPDGYERWVLTMNGTTPGPAIIADWGDNIIIHVTNKLETNGTSIHWHGIRQLGSTEYDGVPGVTQCPIAPGETMTYRFRATQYGSTWYHSHLSVQYGDGLLGPLIINGPATADYDEDLGMLFLSDWTHQSAAQLWSVARLGIPPILDTGLMNGTNTWDCSGSTDLNCVGGGKKFETVFEAGKKYRIRIINSALEGHFQFSIDGHSLKVIGNDLVPIIPYVTDNVLISMGQRYDLIVEANQAVGDYWIRGGWVAACSANHNPANITGILRYSKNSTADPTTTSNVTIGTACGDEPLARLVPHLALNVDPITESEVNEEILGDITTPYFMWTLNSSSLLLNWTEPALLRVLNNESIFPTDYNVVQLSQSDAQDIWTVLVIQDESGIGLDHPIHLHGHDFWVVAQESGRFSGNTSEFNLINPTRRDVASLPGNGYLALAFKKDNPGMWLTHCHIAWHASQGLALEFVERENEITIGSADSLRSVCTAWDNYAPSAVYQEDDSGI